MHARQNGMRWIRGYAVVTVLIAATLVMSGCGIAAKAVGVPPDTGRQNVGAGTGRSCELPAPDQVPSGQRLGGPAVSALRGGAASHGFSLDGGKLSVEPPPPGEVPSVSRTLAECEALAAIGSSGGSLAVVAGESGLAIGYALVTVSPRLPVNSDSWDSFSPQRPPAPASYRTRLAWVVVFRPEQVASCPATVVSSPQATPTSAKPAYAGYGYEVFLIDAATGGDALVYDETEPNPCDGPGDMPANVAVPIEETSVNRPAA